MPNSNLIKNTVTQSIFGKAYLTKLNETFELNLTRL